MATGSTGANATAVQVSHDTYTGHVEPDMAINPRDPSQILAASQAEQGPRVRVPVAYFSLDGGRHWGPTKMLALPAGNVMGADTTVGFSADGTGYVAATVVGGQGGGYASRVDRGAILVWRTPDSGQSFEAPTVVFAGTTFQDHPWLAIDRDGTLSIAWTDQAGLRFAQSRDGGRRFAPARVLIPGASPLDPVVVASRADLRVYFESIADHAIQIHVLQSVDHGATFTAPVLVGAAVEDHLPGQGEKSKSGTELPLFAATAAPSGTADFVAVAEFQQAVGAPRILIWRSTNNAARWTAPLSLDDALTRSSAQTQPRLAAAPDGSLEILYLATSRTGAINVVLTRLLGTRTATGRLLTTFCVPAGTFIGDYQALLTAPNPELAMWNGEPTGRDNGQLQILMARLGTAKQGFP